MGYSMGVRMRTLLNTTTIPRLVTNVSFSVYTATSPTTTTSNPPASAGNSESSLSTAATATTRIPNAWSSKWYATNATWVCAATWIPTIPSTATGRTGA